MGGSFSTLTFEARESNSSVVVAPVEDHRKTKKADAAEHPMVQNHIGLLVNGPPGMAEMPFI